MALSWADLEDRMATALVGGAVSQPVTYTPASTGVPLTIRGSHDHTALEVLQESGASRIATTAEVRLRAADLAAVPVRGDAVTVGGASYTVGEVHRDGQAMWRLRLREA